MWGLALSDILNLTTSGLANHIQFNGSDRLALNQTNTTLHGDVVCGPHVRIVRDLRRSIDGFDRNNYQRRLVRLPDY